MDPFYNYDKERLLQRRDKNVLTQYYATDKDKKVIMTIQKEVLKKRRKQFRCNRRKSLGFYSPSKGRIYKQTNESDVFYHHNFGINSNGTKKTKINGLNTKRN